MVHSKKYNASFEEITCCIQMNIIQFIRRNNMDHSKKYHASFERISHFIRRNTMFHSKKYHVSFEKYAKVRDFTVQWNPSVIFYIGLSLLKNLFSPWYLLKFTCVCGRRMSFIYYNSLPIFVKSRHRLPNTKSISCKTRRSKQNIPDLKSKVSILKSKIYSWPPLF